MKHVFLFVLLLHALFSLVPVAAQQECTPRSCASFSNLPATNKGPHVVRIGTILGDTTAESLARWAAYRINSNQSILPNVTLEVYTTKPDKDTAQQVAASLELAEKKKTSFVVLDVDDFYLTTPAEVFSAFKVPTIAISSTSNTYFDKQNYPYLMRTSPSDYYEYKTILHIIKSFGIKSVTYLFASDYVGYSTFANLAFYEAIAVTPILLSAPGTPFKTNTTSTRAVIINLPYVPTMPYGYLAHVMIQRLHLFGPSYLYIFTRSSNHLYQLIGFYPWLQGSLSIQTLQNVNQQYLDQVQNEWNYTDRSIFPGADQPSSWHAFDSVNQFAFAMDTLIKSGKSIDSISGRDIMDEIINSSYPSITGPYFFDYNNDKLGQFQVKNIRTNMSGQAVAFVMDWNTGILSNLSVQLAFYGGSTENPATVIRCWELCNITMCNFRGNCSDEGKCVCMTGFSGEFCETAEVEVIRYKEGLSTLQIVAIAAPAGLAILLITAVYFVYIRWSKHREPVLNSNFNELAVIPEGFFPPPGTPTNCLP